MTDVVSEWLAESLKMQKADRFSLGFDEKMFTPHHIDYRHSPVFLDFDGPLPLEVFLLVVVREE